MKAVKPELRPDVVLSVTSKNGDPPPSEWTQWTGETSRGHFFAEDLARVRLELHARGCCHRLQLSAVGSMKALR